MTSELGRSGAAETTVSGAPGAEPATQDPSWARLGRWDPVFTLPNVAIHVHVLPNGKVLFWGRRDHPEGTLNEHECTPYIWDPGTGDLVPTPQPTRGDGTTKVNLFCSGHAFLPDGRLLVAGGHLFDNEGIDQACIYDYRTNTWTPIEVMNNGRWYPNATSLSDGTVLVSGGSYSSSTGIVINDIPQIWTGTQWTSISRNSEVVLPLYPRMHVAPNGQVFMSGAVAQTFLLDTAGTGTWSGLKDGTRQAGFRDYAPSVLYDVGKVIYVGGGNEPPPNSPLPTDVVEVIDLGAQDPKWQSAAKMHSPRIQHNGTILADGTVLVTGGTSGSGFNDLSPGKPVHVAELWDPRTGHWTELAAEDRDRCYHATAVLLPDATVLSAGGGEFAVNTPTGQEPNDPKDSHRDAQIFHPPYLFRGPRPEIVSAPGEVDYGQTFTVEVSGPEVGNVTWIRLPSVTHAFNQNQRINVLGFSVNDAGLAVTAPDRSELCPPGHYMLFVLSKAGVPSHARITRIGPPTPRRRDAVTGATRGAEPAELMSTEERDEAIRTQATGTRVTVGLTSNCPYGLGACWAGAYEALTKLDDVAAVAPIANAHDSTAEVYLRDQTLPDLDKWPGQFARWANGSYTFRGVEVTLTGTVAAHDGSLLVTGHFSASPVTLMPFTRDLKLQWDFRTGSVREVTSEEQDAYQSLERACQDRENGSMQFRVTGPLTNSGDDWVVYVRKFENEPAQ